MVEQRLIRSRRRFNVSLPLWVRFRQPPAGKIADRTKEELTATINMSSGGCFFYTSQKPALGTPAIMVLDVSARAPGKRGGKVLCQGKVVRVSKQECQNKIGVACTIDSYSFMVAGRDEGSTLGSRI
jgi:hypothetical protein